MLTDYLVGHTVDRSTLSESLPNSRMSPQLHHSTTEGSVPNIDTYHYDLSRFQNHRRIFLPRRDHTTRTTT
eukprot:3890408-Rhodomonas_salina.1